MAPSTFHTTLLWLYAVVLFLVSQPPIVSAQFCTSGTFRLPNGTCQPCAPGYYTTFTNEPACSPCHPGRFLRVPRAEAFEACQNCPAGTFAAEGASECTPCPRGTSSSNGSSRCVQCPPGSRIVDAWQSGCVPCAGGFSVRPNQLQCLPCPPRTAAPPGATSFRQCQRCAPGTAPDRTGCAPCQPGSFSTDGLLCRRCPPGTRAQERASTECEACPPGSFSPNISFFFSRQCELCPLGTTTFGSSTTICRRQGGPCPYNHIENAKGDCVRCPVDMYYDRDQQVCRSCPDGFGSAGGLPLQCSPCFDVINARVDESHCSQVFKDAVPADADGNCAPGTYVSEIDGRTCILCKEGTFTNTTNASGVVDSVDQQIGCRRCPAGFVQPERGASSCIKCEAGTEPSSFAQKCVKAHDGCEIGSSRVARYRRSTSCEMDTCNQTVDITQFKGRVCSACGTGQFRRKSGECERCPPTSLGDGLRCVQCPKGTVQFGDSCACRGLVALNRGMINGSCQLCPAGSYGAPKGGVESDHECRKCAAGTYRNVVDESRIAACSSIGGCNTPPHCKVCAAGSFSDEDGATECKPCPPGSFSYGIGETECLEFGAASKPVPFDEPIRGSRDDDDGEVASPEAGEVASPEVGEVASPEAGEVASPEAGGEESLVDSQ